MPTLTAPLPTHHSGATPSAKPHATPDALDLLEQFGSTVIADAGHEIYAQGGDADYCWRVLSGCVREVKLMEDGRREVNEFRLVGEYFGFDDLGTHEFSAEAVNHVVLRRYPRRMVDKLAEGHLRLGQRLRAMTLSSLREAHERALLLSRKTAAERMASFILDIQRRSAGRGADVLEFPMPRTDIADHLGLTTETVCRTLASLKREGLLVIARTGVQVRSATALRELACCERH